MLKDNFHTLGDILKKAVIAYKLEKKIQNEQIKNAWYTVVGNFCGQYTTSIKFKDGVLIVEISSAALKQELLYSKSNIIIQLNKFLNQTIVKDLKII